MDNTALNSGYLLANFLLCIPLLAWILLSLITISRIRKDNLNETARALWVLIVLLVPILGVLVYWWVKPGSANAARE